MRRAFHFAPRFDPGLPLQQPLLEYVEKLPQRYSGVGLSARLLAAARARALPEDARVIERALELVLPVLAAGANVREYRAAAKELEKVAPGKGAVDSSRTDAKEREAAAKLDACVREYEAHAASQLRENQRVRCAPCARARGFAARARPPLTTARTRRNTHNRPAARSAQHWTLLSTTTRWATTRALSSFTSRRANCP